MGMATAAATCKVLQLLSAAAAAAALHGSCLSGRYWLRAACQRRATLNVRRDIDVWQPPRCRPTTFALMCADAIVLTDFCVPVQQDSIEHRVVSLGGSTDSGWAHGTSSVQRGERRSPRPP
jgi:hypothetical protein